jgi:hypothetical protein
MSVKKRGTNNMTRKEEYHCEMSSIYRSGRDFIKSSKMYYGLKLEVLCNSYIILFDEILYCAFLDDFITLDDFKELTKYADKLTRYLRECLE